MKHRLHDEVSSIRMGDIADFTNYRGAVIDEKAFRRLTAVLREAHDSDELEILVGGTADDSVGWFVEPTIVVTDNPRSRFMSDEFFGPIVTVYPYDDDRFEET